MKSTHSAAARAAGVMAMAGSAMAQWPALATITPCPAAPASLSYEPITVTEQYQPIWTCNPTSVCQFGTCSSAYPTTTFDYLSTEIPCYWSGTTGSTCTVTATDEPVTVSQTITYSPISPTGTAGGYPGWQANGNVSTTTAYATITKYFVHPFNQLGPMAMPHWGGSGRCEQCQPDHNGRMIQPMGVHQCQDGDCEESTVTWVQQPGGPSQTAPVSAECATSTYFPSAGTYTIPFQQWAPETTMTVPASTITVTVGGYPTMSHVPRSTVTIHPQPWTAWVTQTCTGPTTVDFTTTITDTVTYTLPCSTITSSATVTVTSSTSMSNSATLTSTYSTYNTNTVSPTLTSTSSTSTNIASPTLTSTTSMTTLTTTPVFPNTTTTTTTTSETTTTTTTTTDNTISPTLTSTTSTTTTTTTTTSTTLTTITTTTSDVSADLNVPDPTSEPGVQPTLRRRNAHHRVRMGGRFYKRSA